MHYALINWTYANEEQIIWLKSFALAITSIYELRYISKVETISGHVSGLLIRYLGDF